MAELRSLLNDGEDDVSIFAISVDSREKTNRLLKKIAKDGKGELGFPILSDPDHKTISAYKLLDKNYIGTENEGIPHPAIFILDKDREILWSKIESNYRIRPTLSEVRGALDRAKNVADNKKTLNKKP